MDIDFKGLTLAEEVVDVNKLVRKIQQGKAMLFLGAGFSRTAVNIDGVTLSASIELSHALSQECGIPKNDNLRFTSDYYLSKFSSKKIIELLGRFYTIKSLSNDHKIVANLPWRRCYTTNYDRCFEIASEQVGLKVETIDLTHETSEFYKRGNLCVHLNGSINSLNEESLNNSFKLSDSSYSSADSFLDSEWFYYFKRDLDRSNCIIFLGYSMYDIEIKKILSSDPDLKEKTYFITAPNPDLESKFTLSKFGSVVPIGLEGFAKAASETLENYSADHEYISQSLAVYNLTNETEHIRDDEIEKLLMYGDLGNHHIDNFILGNSKVPFLVKRTIIEKTLSFIDAGKHVVLYSALGNGKTIMIKQLRSFLTLKGFECYEIEDEDADFIADVDFLAKTKDKSIILLDRYEKYIELIEHIARADYDNITVLATSRVADHEYHREQLDMIPFKYSEVNIDILDEDEIKAFVKIIDNLGLWGEKAGYTEHQKMRYLSSENSSQFSITLLTLLNSPQIKNKLSGLLTQLKKNKKHEDTMIAICLCQILGIDPNRSIISELAGNDSIYEPAFTLNKNFKEIFNFNNGKVINGSSLFCIFLLKNNFSATSITQRMLAIASKFSQLGAKNHEQDRIFKAMLKFSFIEQLLPENLKIGNLQRYYEDLKIEVSWLSYNPHFWLQYAMCYIAFQNFPKAQQFLDQAYALATQRKNYHTNNIDTQQAKLYLLSSEKVPDGNIVFSNFEKANNLLSNLNVDIYTLRQIAKYKEFHANNIHKLSKINKAKFLEYCKNMLAKISKHENDESVSQSTLLRAKEVLVKIIG
ncbi:SIR2 family protein [Pantoea agglomerans]|uniref:SIR2 family protein n=1 Tax=Enterobacter agglomerans TaxID=549 RepID=UPI001A8FF51C|nr:SIR2 family protein [Pantoea agglomerans]MBN9929643.1 SIR2 family protein [Pantoea agglomerans]